MQGSVGSITDTADRNFSIEKEFDVLGTVCSYILWYVVTICTFVEVSLFDKCIHWQTVVFMSRRSNDFI